MIPAGGDSQSTGEKDTVMRIGFHLQPSSVISGATGGRVETAGESAVRGSPQPQDLPPMTMEEQEQIAVKVLCLSLAVL